MPPDPRRPQHKRDAPVLEDATKRDNTGQPAECPGSELVSYSVSVRLEHGAMTSFPCCRAEHRQLAARRLRTSRSSSWSAGQGVGIAPLIDADVASANLGWKISLDIRRCERVEARILPIPIPHGQMTVCLTFDVDAESGWLGQGTKFRDRLTTLSEGRYGVTGAGRGFSPSSVSSRSPRPSTFPG